jgi:hypothetical protein
MHRLLQKLMEDKNKFWLCFGGIIALGILGLVGAILGQTIFGYVLYGVGTAGSIGLFVLTRLKTAFYKEGRLRLLIIGFAVGILLAGGILLLVNPGGSTAMLQMPSGATSGTFPQGGALPSGQFTMPTGDAAGSTTTSTFPSGTMPTRTSGSSSTLKTIIGWSLLGLAAASLGLGGFWFLKKKIELKDHRWQVLLLGFLLGALIGSAAVLMFASSTGSMPAGFDPTAIGQNLPGTTATDTTTAAATETPQPTVSITPAATETPEPTTAPTVDVISRLVVCLDADVVMANYLYDIPSDTGKITGTIPAAGCFTINGRSAANPGWYHLAPGQDGFGGINIYVDDSTTDLWVYTVNIDATESNLNRLQDIVVTPEN